MALAPLQIPIHSQLVLLARLGLHVVSFPSFSLAFLLLALERALPLILFRIQFLLLAIKGLHVVSLASSF